MNESFEEKFRAGLNRYIEIERKKPTAIADAAGIPRPKSGRENSASTEINYMP
jgi:hypothetical protein